ncbi:MAG TPA: type II secretion system protein GspC [Candidatus Binataceae bacterium]|nr:type II secretion system protein GspC [Candidatus Binataceae bacterium]
MELGYSERYLVVLNAVLVAAMAYFAALCVNDIISRRLHPVVSPASTAAVAAPLSASHARSYYDQIARRDIFNLEPVHTRTLAPPPVARELHVKLLGTSQITIGQPFAIVEDTRTGRQLLYRVGDKIPDTGRLVEVRRTSVIIDEGAGKLATIRMESTNLGPAAPGAKPMRRRKLRPRGGVGVRRYGNNRYMLKREVVNKNLANMAQLFTQIRAVPNMVGGHADGYVLSDIQPGSIFQQIGLHDGDILMNINGQDVRDPAQAMQMFATLRNAPSLTLQVQREGAPVQMHYTIQ